MIKRSFDCAAACAGLCILAPLFAVVALLIKWDSAGPVFFRHRRVGRGFRPIDVYKFRTMVHDTAGRGSVITLGGRRDPRITRVGRLLRATKIDELPQLWNVVRGDMSLVGPRPEVSHYVRMFRDDYEHILQVRPGMTDLASLAFRDEASVLERAADPEREYVARILPAKIAMAKQYIRDASLAGDVGLVLRTVFSVVAPRIAGSRR